MKKAFLALPLFFIIILSFSVSAAVTFEDDFNDNNMDGWEVVEGETHWSVENGKLVARRESPYYGEAGMIVAGDFNWDNYIFEADVTPSQSAVLPEVALVFRYVDHTNRYEYINFGWQNSKTALACKGYVGSISESGQLGKTYHLKAVVNGNHIQTYRDGILIFDKYNDCVSHGKIGFLNGGPTLVYYDNVKVTGIVEDSDKDTVPDSKDICPGTVLPETTSKSLKSKRYADIDGDGIFETVREGKIVDSEYTLKNTSGCSCKQILDIESDENKCEIKFGCKKYTLKFFIAVSEWVKNFFGH